ncbi:hypothetical protein KO528_08300 [Saccharophagus degradans]|uniref:hypothetical protein n=1 Tax=Saccharophagus degradans TaxID=86304 RepID=UPI001C08EAA7|nr:hypothetical protein [Saccharophagus degradans]MBU2985349.1 hypothetical protein [Saccharophagus degradans]
MKIKNRLWLVLLFGLLSNFSHSQTTATPSPPVVKLNVSGWSPNLKNYYIALFEELLVLAEPQFGPHVLAPVSLEISTKRAILLSETGELPLGFATRWESMYNNIENSNLYYYPYLNRLLGLRQIIVPTSKLADFTNSMSFEEFRALKPGQGAGWPDAEIYKAHGIEVVNAKSYEHLFPMLLLNRFDYVPLSILEIDGVLAQINKSGNTYSVVPNLYIYYPIPVYIRSNKISTHTDKLVAYALKRYFSEEHKQQNQQLFDSHFAHANKALPTREDTIFYLDNHALEDDLNEQFKHEFKQLYKLSD